MAAKVGLLVFLLVIALGSLPLLSYRRRLSAVESRIRRLAGEGEEEQAPRRRASSRIHGLVLRLTPAGYMEHLELMLLRAGEEDASAVSLVARQLALGAAGLFLGTMASLSGAVPPPVALMMGAAGLLLPYARLKTRVEERMQRVTHELPLVLDLLSILVDAGLTFDAAVQRLARRQKGVLVDALVAAQRDIQWHRGSRAQVYREMARRLGVPEVERLVAALIGAEARGAPVGPVLHVHSREIHRERRARAHKAAAEVGVRILGPMFVCFMPVLAGVVVYPVVVMFMQLMRG